MGVGEPDGAFETSPAHLNTPLHKLEKLTLLRSELENIASIEGVEKLVLDFII